MFSTVRPFLTRPVAVVIGLTLPLLVVGGCSDDQAAAPAAGTTVAADGGAGAASLEQTYDRTIRRVLPSVVEIRTTTGLGSGVIWDDAGNIVTNAHVVGTATRFEVQLANRAGTVPARLVGTYPPDDLAVIRVEGDPELDAATFGDSAEANVGDLVLAMGNPLGLSASVTNGIISATGRIVEEPAGEGSAGTVLPDAIQTSADINPGNSGGALVNLQAEVIGIPTLAALSPGGTAPAPGIGFAVSAARVKRIAPQLIRDGRVTDSGRAALGAGVTTVADAEGNPAGIGVLTVIPRGPAATAGIRPGDILMEVARQPTASVDALGTVLAAQKVGATVEAAIMRDGDRRTLKVTLGDLGSP